MIILLIAFLNIYTVNFPLASEKYAFLKDIMFRQEKNRQKKLFFPSVNGWMQSRFGNKQYDSVNAFQ